MPLPLSPFLLFFLFSTQEHTYHFSTFQGCFLLNFTLSAFPDWASQYLLNTPNTALGSRGIAVNKVSFVSIMRAQFSERGRHFYSKIYSRRNKGCEDTEGREQRETGPFRRGRRESVSFLDPPPSLQYPSLVKTWSFSFQL